MSEVGALLAKVRGETTCYRLERDGIINHGTLLRIERGDQLPNALTLDRIAAYLDTDVLPLLKALARDRYRADLITVFGAEHVETAGRWLFMLDEKEDAGS